MPAQSDQTDFFVVRLGGKSTDAIERILTATPGYQSPRIEIAIKCKQVPVGVGAGSIAFVWLGTDNNKGGPTAWLQGLRALGEIVEVSGGERYDDEKTVSLSLGVILPESLTKKDFVRDAAGDYIRIADLPVVGINNYSSQVVQRIDVADASQQVAVLLSSMARLSPGFAEASQRAYPKLESNIGTIPLESTSDGVSDPTVIDIPNDDDVFTELLATVRRLLKDNYGGVVLRGAPGTSKSWYARRIAAALTDKDPSRMRFVQFHSSYQYEDFVEGYVPDVAGTFQRVDKIFLKACNDARSDTMGRAYVIIIDELSRTEPARIFGEALTYLEQTKRGEKFLLSSGQETSVPANLIVLATMNTWDRGVDEVDAAIERRFASISLDPSGELLIRMLDRNQVHQNLRDRIVKFFDFLLRQPNHMLHIGHAYFHGIKDESSLHRLWNHQLRFLISRAFPLQEDGFVSIERVWKKHFPVTPEIIDTSSPDRNDNSGE